MITSETGEGKTPAIADGQARQLLDAPPPNTLKGKRDRAILAVLFFHGLRQEELCKLRIKDVEQRHGVIHYRILYFFHGNVAAVVSHALTKERAVPPREIELAIKRRARFLANPTKRTFLDK